MDDDENDRSSTGETLARIPGVEVVDSYGSGEEALNRIHASGADIALIDIRMPRLSGIESTRLLKARTPRLKIVMITGLLDTRWINESRQAGADGYLAKPVCARQFLAWITFSFARQPHACEEPSTSAVACDSAANSMNLASLNSREIDVAQLVSKGYRNKEIAGQLGISEAVVGKLLKRIRRKLGATNRAELAILFHSGLLPGVTGRLISGAH